MAGEYDWSVGEGVGEGSLGGVYYNAEHNNYWYGGRYYVSRPAVLAAGGTFYDTASGGPPAPASPTVPWGGGGGGGGSSDRAPQRVTHNGVQYWWDPDNPDVLVPITGGGAAPGADWGSATWLFDGPRGGVYRASNGQYMYQDIVYNTLSELNSVINGQGGIPQPPGDAPRKSYGAPTQDPVTGKWGRWNLTDGVFEELPGGPNARPDTSSAPRSGSGVTSISGGGGSSGGSSRSTFTPDYSSSGGADQTAAWAHSDAQSALQREWQAAQNDIDRAMAAYQFAQRMGLDTQKFALDLQQARQTAAEVYARLVSTPDLNALDAFLQAGGGNVSNALAGGANMLTDEAIRPAAMQLQNIRDMGVYNPYGPASGGGGVGGTGATGGTPGGGVSEDGTPSAPGTMDYATSPATPQAVTPTDMTKIPLGVTQQLFAPDPADPTKQVQVGWRLSDGTVIANDGTVRPHEIGVTSPGSLPNGEYPADVLDAWIKQPKPIGNSQMEYTPYDPNNVPANVAAMMKGLGGQASPAYRWATENAFDSSGGGGLPINNPGYALYREWIADYFGNAQREDYRNVPPEMRPKLGPSAEDQILVAEAKKGAAPPVWNPYAGQGGAAGAAFDPTRSSGGDKLGTIAGPQIPIGSNPNAPYEPNGTPISDIGGRPGPVVAAAGVPLPGGREFHDPWLDAPTYGDGGYMRGMGIVGERGKPELVIAPKGAMVIPMDRMNRMMPRVRRYGNGGAINPYEDETTTGIAAPATPWKTADTNGNFNPVSPPSAPPAGGGPMYGYPGGGAGHDPFPPAPSAPGTLNYQAGMTAPGAYSEAEPAPVPTAPGPGRGTAYPVPNIVPTYGPTGGQNPNLPTDSGGDPMETVRRFRENAKTLPGFNPYDVSFWNQPSAWRQQGFMANQTKYGVPVDVQQEEAQRMRLQGTRGRYGY